MTSNREEFYKQDMESLTPLKEKIGKFDNIKIKNLSYQKTPLKLEEDICNPNNQ